MILTEVDACPLTGSMPDSTIRWERETDKTAKILIPFRTLGNLTDEEACHESAMARAYSWDREPGTGRVRLWGGM